MCKININNILKFDFPAKTKAEIKTPNNKTSQERRSQKKSTGHHLIQTFLLPYLHISLLPDSNHRWGLFNNPLLALENQV